MIKIDDHRKANLEMMFQGTPDRDLLHELVRRGRFRQIQATAKFWPEMREQSGYMDSIQKQVTHYLADGLAATKIAGRSVMHEETHLGDGQSVLKADIIVLCERSPKDK